MENHKTWYMVEKMLETILSIPNALTSLTIKAQSPYSHHKAFQVCYPHPAFYSGLQDLMPTSFPGHSTPTTVTTLPNPQRTIRRIPVPPYLWPLCWVFLLPHRNHFLTALNLKTFLPQLTFPLLRFIFLHHNIIKLTFCSSPQCLTLSYMRTGISYFFTAVSPDSPN